MNKNNDLLIRDISDEEMINDLQKLLDEELARPEGEQDLDTIAELSRTITGLSGINVPEPPVDVIMSEVSARKKRQKIRRICCWAVSLSACLVIGIALNIYSISTFGQNAFLTAIEYTKNGFSLDFSKDDPDAYFGPPMAPGEDEPSTVPAGTEPLDTSSTPGAAAGGIADYMLRKSMETELGDDIWLPDYSSEKFGTFVPTDFSYEELQDSYDLYFSFSSGKFGESLLDITIERYNDAEHIPSQLVPSESYDVHGGVCADDTHVYFFKEDYHHMTAIFLTDNTVYTIYGYYLDSNEFESFVSSFGPDHKN